MDNTKQEISAEQEWQWCLVGNIMGEHEHGENHELRFGTNQFRAGTKVFINLVYGGMGHESILVIGTPRYSCKYIEIVIARKYVENFRLQKVFTPAVLKQMEKSAWDWWGNTDSARDEIIRILEWLNPSETANARSKFYVGTKDNDYAPAALLP